MYDFAQPNAKPGPCSKCKGTGVYSWGGTVNGRPVKQGPCHSCRGTGQQTRQDIKRNVAYNRHKVVRLAF